MYTPLYIKTNNELLSSMIDIPKLIAFAKKHQLKHLTITDSNLYGALDFYYACINENINPIIGLEVTYQENKIVLYAKNYSGYQNLTKLSTKISETEISLNDLKQHANDLICILPFASKHLEMDCSFYEDLFLGFSTLEEEKQLKGKKIFLRKALYLEKQDKKYLPYLYAIRDGILVSEVEEIKNDYEIVLNPISNENNEYISSHCKIEIKQIKHAIPTFPCPDGLDSYTYLKKQCIEGLKRIFGQTVSKIYLERLKYELNVIQKMGFCDYFLIVADYVNYAKTHNCYVGPGRGSAAGSLVSYCLNITTIDPIYYQLLFERFLNPERITMPDIDVDFEADQRDHIVSYCIEKYGKKKVAPIITFGTLGAKQVIRDVARVMNLVPSKVDSLAKLLDSKCTLQENYAQNHKLQELIKNDPIFSSIYQISLQLEGFKRHTSIHAAGVVMSKYDLDDMIPLVFNDPYYLTGYSMDYLENLGLLKMDFLVIRTLNSVHQMVLEIQKKQPEFSLETIPLTDQKTLELFMDANTLGIFQFESAGMIQFLKKLKPNTFEELFAAVSLFRPGPMDNIDHYIKRKKGLETIDYFHEDLKPILKTTYGIIIYQEQVMQIAHTLAGYTLGEADVLRRAMSKKKEDVLLEEKEKFITRSQKLGYEKQLATSIYDLILKFASYGFNRSHAVAYARLAYQMAYIKAHYPLCFMKNLLTLGLLSETKTKEYIYECKLNQIVILKPDIQKSEKEYVIEENKIRFPLTGIKNVGMNAVDAIMKEKSIKEFTDIFDFVKRLYGKSMNRKTLESLILSGCFDRFGINHQTLMVNLDAIINYGELVKDLEEEFALKPELDEIEEYSQAVKMQQELDLFGFYLSDHPITAYKVKYKDTVHLEDISLYFDKIISVLVMVDRKKEIKTKKEETMCFITGSDEMNTIDLVLFPRIYEKYPNIQQGQILLVTGKVEKRFDQMQLVVNSLKKID